MTLSFSAKIAPSKTITNNTAEIFLAIGSNFIATFDAKLKFKDGRFDYNWKNCVIARNLFQNQIGVEVKYWCEKGYVR